MKISVIDKINLYLRTCIHISGNIIKVYSWMPFFYLAGLQFLGLLILTSFSLPGWNSIIKPLLSSIMPKVSFHFPQYLLIVPRLFSDYDNYILGPTAYIILSAAAVFVLGGLYANERWPLREGIGRAFRSYFKLLIVWALELLLVYLVFQVVSLLFADLVYGSPKRIMALRTALQFAAFIPSAFLIYAIPAIMLDKQPLFKAICSSVELCGHNFFLTYFIIFIPGLLRLIFDIIIKDFGMRIVNTMNADLIVIIMIIKIIAGIFINLFILGGATYVYKAIGSNNRM